MGSSLADTMNLHAPQKHAGIDTHVTESSQVTCSSGSLLADTLNLRNTEKCRK
jgi:hypothetical protein